MQNVFASLSIQNIGIKLITAVIIKQKHNCFHSVDFREIVAIEQWLEHEYCRNHMAETQCW